MMEVGSSSRTFKYAMIMVSTVLIRVAHPFVQRCFVKGIMISAASGETDFKGETSTLTTQQRIDYPNRYAEVLPNHVKNFDLDTPIVPLESSIERLKAIKPRPQVRRRIHLDEWRWIGDASAK